MSIISLSQAIEQRNAPDADCMSHDIEGNPVERYTLNYRHDGREHSFHIWARSADHAEAHAVSIRESVEVGGLVLRVG